MTDVSTDRLRREQRGVALNALPALALACLVYGFLVSGQRQGPVDLAAIGFAIKFSLLPGLCVLLAIANVAGQRFHSADNISSAVGEGDSKDVAIGNAILRNTLEQAFLAVVLYLALAALLERPEPVIIALACMFGAGRLFFVWGYRRGAAARAFGFGLTFYPHIIGFAHAIFLALR